MAERHKQFLLEPEGAEQNGPMLREVGGADHIPDVSLTLRLARQRAGYEIKDVAEVLRIRAAHLEAIESGRFKDLPGPTYVTGFLRSYADFLGLDRDEIVNRYRDEIGAAARQKLSFPVPSFEGRMPRPWLILVALVLVGLAYGGWHYYSTRDAGTREMVAEPPAAATSVASGVSDQGGSGETTPNSAASTPDATKEPGQGASDGKGEVATARSDTGSAAASGVGGSLFRGDGASSGASVAQPAPDTVSDAVAPADNAPADNAPADSAPATVSTAGSLWDGDSAPAPASSDAAAATATDEGLAATSAPPADEDDFGATVVEPTPESGTSAQAGSTSGATVETLSAPTEADIAALEQGGEEVVVDAASEAAPAAVAGGESRVVISARADSWVQIQGPGNELVMTRILRPGESYAVPDRPGLTMVTGNAGGLEITVDGQPIGSLGAMGVVKRGIELSPERLRDAYGSVDG